MERLVISEKLKDFYTKKASHMPIIGRITVGSGRFFGNDELMVLTVKRVRGWGHFFENPWDLWYHALCRIL